MNDNLEDTRAVREAVELALPDRIPPTTLTSTTLLRAGRHKRLRRRLALSGCVAGVAALSVAGVVGVGYLTAPPAQPTLRAGGPGPSASPSASPSPTQETQAQAITRLTALLQGLVKADLPDAQLTNNDWVGGGQHNTSPALTFTPRQQYAVLAAVDVHDAQGSGAISVYLSPDPSMLTQHGCATGGWAFPGNATTCTTRVVNGTNVTIATTRTATGATEYYVFAVRPDGTAAALQDQPYAEADIDHTKNMTAPAPERPTPPLTVDQAVAIITNPNLHYDSTRPAN